MEGKLNVKWEYLLCLNTHTAFLLCTAHFAMNLGQLPWSRYYSTPQLHSIEGTWSRSILLRYPLHNSERGGTVMHNTSVVQKTEGDGYVFQLTIHVLGINGSLLVKLKKSIPLMLLP